MRLKAINFISNVIRAPNKRYERAHGLLINPDERCIHRELLRYFEYESLLAFCSSIPHHTRNFHCFFLWMQQGCLSVYGYLLNILLQGKKIPKKKRELLFWGKKNTSTRISGKAFDSFLPFRNVLLIKNQAKLTEEKEQKKLF